MFSPILPGTSLASWAYLQTSQDDQLEVFANDATLSREQTHFAEKIATMTSVDDLMSDYQALKVALGAHGLEEDLPNRYFVRQVIEQGVSSEDSFANQLSDSRYAALAETFETLGLTGTGDLNDAALEISADLEAAVEGRFGDSPLYKATAARLENNLVLGMLGADSTEKAWARVTDDPGLNASLVKILGTHSNASSLTNSEQAGLFSDSVEFIYGSNSLNTLIDPDNAFAVADAYLGTAGFTLEAGFSYGGLKGRFDAIFAAEPDSAHSTDADADAARWAALQADTTLRDIVAETVGVSAGFAALNAADQIAELKVGTQSFFGRNDFGAFAAQANVSELADRYIDPDDSALTQVFTLGAFTEQMIAARDADVAAYDKWQSVLEISDFKDAVVDAYGISDEVAVGEEADLIAALMAETEARFGDDDVAVFQNPDKLATLSGLFLDTRINDINSNYVEQSFRIAVGDLRPELRVAMSVAEELQSAVTTGGTEDGQWYRVLGSEILRTAFEAAYGLDSSFANVDLDLQVKTMRERSLDLIGSETVDGFLDADNQEKFIDRYLLLAGSSSSTISDPSLSLFGEASASTILATVYSGS